MGDPKRMVLTDTEPLRRRRAEYLCVEAEGVRADEHDHQLNGLAAQGWVLVTATFNPDKCTTFFYMSREPVNHG